MTETVLGRVNIDCAKLLKAVQRCALVIERRNTIPILGMIRLEAFDGGTLRLRCTDLDNELTLDLACEVVTPFAFMVDPRLLAQMARANAGQLTLSLMAGEGKALDTARPPVLHIAGDMIKLRVAEVCQVADYPEGKPVATPHQTEASAEALRRLIWTAQPAISKEPARYYLHGIYLHQKPGAATLRAVTTDGHRLALVDGDIPYGGAGVIWPEKSARVALALWKTGKGMVKLTTSEIRISLSDAENGISLVSKAIDGTYPNYTRVVPKQLDGIDFTVSAAKVAALGAFSTARGRAVKFEPDAGRMSIECLDDGVKAEAALTGRGEGIGFNANYINDFSARMPVMRFRGNSKGDPCMITGTDPDVFYVLMPMRV